MMFLVQWNDCPADIDGHLNVPWAVKHVGWDRASSSDPATGIIARVMHTSEEPFGYEMIALSGLNETDACVSLLQPTPATAPPPKHRCPSHWAIRITCTALSPLTSPTHSTTCLQLDFNFYTRIYSNCASYKRSGVL